MKRRARRNPLVQDPSVLNATDIQFEVVRLVAEYSGLPDDEPGVITRYIDFDLRRTWSGSYQILFNSDLGYWNYWNPVLGSWYATADWMSIGDEPRFFYVPNDRSGRFYMAQRIGTLRVYRIKSHPS